MTRPSKYEEGVAITDAVGGLPESDRQRVILELARQAAAALVPPGVDAARLTMEEIQELARVGQAAQPVIPRLLSWMTFIGAAPNPTTALDVALPAFLLGVELAMRHPEYARALYAWRLEGEPPAEGANELDLLMQGITTDHLAAELEAAIARREDGMDATARTD